MKRSSPILRLIALFLCACLSMPLMSGCDLEQSITDWLVSYDEEKAFPIPQVRTLKNRDAAEHAVFDYYTPLVRALERNRDLGFRLRHDITRDGSCVSIKSYITDEGGGRWDITEIAVYTDGTVYAPDMGDISYIEDGPFFSGCLKLCRSGYFADVEKHGRSMSCGQVYSEMIKYYELYSGNEIDYSRMAFSVSGAPEYLKAAELFMDHPSSDLYYDSSNTAGGMFFLGAASTLLAEMIFAPGACSSKNADVCDIIDVCGLLFGFIKPDAGENRAIDWKNRTRALMDKAPELTYYDATSNRDLVAFAFMELYESAFGSLDWVKDDVKLDDSSNQAALKCVNAGFLEEFPNDNLFSGNYIYYFGALPKAAERYVERCYELWCDGTVFPTLFDYTDFIVYMGQMTDYIDRFEERSTLIKETMNTRDYSFYIKQHDGTKYQYVNCMPTITAMAYRWYTGDSVTPSQVRALFLPDTTEGWYMWQVEDALDHYHMPHDSFMLDIDKMTEQLDAGCIILTQMSETNLEYSGHCLVIYGYKRCGDSVRFWCHDPGMDGGENKYGGPRGEGIVRDAGYIYFIIDRFAYSFVTVGDPIINQPAENESAEEIEGSNP